MCDGPQQVGARKALRGGKHDKRPENCASKTADELLGHFVRRVLSLSKAVNTTQVCRAGVRRRD